MEATGRRRETVIQALRAGRLCWLTSALILRLPLSHGNVYASGRCKAVFLLLACCTQEENDVNLGSFRFLPPRPYWRWP
jgi:hypothetical protein